MERYDLLLAQHYTTKALMHLNKVYNLDLIITDIMHADLLGWNFIKIFLRPNSDGGLGFYSMLNELIFDQEDKMTNLDEAAGIKGKNISYENKVLLRIAYTIWRDYNVALKEAEAQQ